MEKGFYNYINSKPRLFGFFVGVFLLLTFGMLLWFYKSVFMDSNVSFYTFSTIVQGFLALIGFLGTVVVFKLQLIETNAYQTVETLKPLLKTFDGIKAHGYSWVEMMNACERVINIKDAISSFGDYIERIKIGLKELKNLHKEKSLLRNAMINFALISLANIVLALIGIPFSKFLISQNQIIYNATYMLSIILLSCLSALSAFNLIRSCLGYSFFLNINTNN